MPRAQNLMGVGFSAQQALASGGQNVATVAGVGTAQTGAASMGSADVIIGTTSGGATAFILPDMNVGESVIFFNSSATAALVFPVTGAQINGLGANNSFSAAQNRPVLFVRTSATQYLGLYGS